MFSENLKKRKNWNCKVQTHKEGEYSWSVSGKLPSLSHRVLTDASNDLLDCKNQSYTWDWPPGCWAAAEWNRHNYEAKCRAGGKHKHICHCVTTPCSGRAAFEFCKWCCIFLYNLMFFFLNFSSPYSSSHNQLRMSKFHFLLPLTSVYG